MRYPDHTGLSRTVTTEAFELQGILLWTERIYDLYSMLSAQLMIQTIK